MSSKSTSILIVEKSGSIKELVVKKLTEEDYYKKAGYKSAEGFKCHTTWSVEIDQKTYNISLYGKVTGRANQENKYEFPPPVDKLLFFGNCLLVNQDNGKLLDLKSKEWEEIYEKLYGGFEDIGDEDSEEDFEDDEDDDLELTKTGYAKDGFIVDEEDDLEDEDDEDDEEDDAEDEDNDDDDIPKIKAKKVSIKKKAIKKSKNKVMDLPSLLKKEEEDETFLDCKSELSEESYIE